MWFHLVSNPVYWSMPSDSITHNNRDTKRTICINRNIMFCLVRTFADENQHLKVSVLSCPWPLKRWIQRWAERNTRMNANTTGSFSALGGRRTQRSPSHGRKGDWWIGQEPLKWHWQKDIMESDYHGSQRIRGDSLGLQQVRCRDLGGVNGRLGL